MSPHRALLSYCQVRCYSLWLLFGIRVCLPEQLRRNGSDFGKEHFFNVILVSQQPSRQTFQIKFLTLGNYVKDFVAVIVQAEHRLKEKYASFFPEKTAFRAIVGKKTNLNSIQ